MSFRNDRRRRYYMDEAPLGATAESRDTQGSGDKTAGADPKDAYGPAARLDRQPRLVEFIPRRYRTLSVLFGFGLAIVGGLEAIYSWIEGLASVAPASLEIADLSAPGSLAAWLSSLWCGLGAMGALLVYSIRRHRMDDYHGRYRIWLLVAFGCSLMSVEETTLWHRLAEPLLASTAARVGFSSAVVALTLGAVLLAYPAIRLVLEIRHCRAALGTFAVGILAWLGSATMAHMVTLEDHLHAVMIIYGAKMIGHLLLLMTLGLYARHILLEVEGRLPARRQKKPRAKKAKPVQEAEKPRVDPPQRAKPAGEIRGDLGPTPSSASRDEEEEEEEDDEADFSNLSRAEKKRIRREQRRMERQS